MMGWNGEMMGGWGIGPGFGWLIQLLFFIVIIYLAFILIRKLNNIPESEKKENRAEEILRERFARGEITEEEYKKMKEVLKN
ncbi:hypothetical protein EWI07_09735 [Sporolactobacillus sp. THM7-4]|nr:hypothetical protein EWI07_09735 [Sporolactobacillus sp. THM7-4]